MILVLFTVPFYQFLFSRYLVLTERHCSSNFKFSKNKDCVSSKQCVSILLCCKVDSDDTQTLINAKDWGEIWRVNETAQNIFIECEKIFRSFTSEFRLVFKYSELVQEMQANSIIISNYDSLCYSIEPKVNKELSWNLLESMLELFVKVRMFYLICQIYWREA